MFNVEFYDNAGGLDHNANVASLEELAEMAQGRTIKITGTEEWTTGDALVEVNAYREGHGLFGTLEALQAMKTDRNLTHRQMRAFNHVFAGFRKMFEGEDA